MPIVYRVYSNGGTGGPIDYGRPIASTTGTTATIGPLAAPGDYRLAVRASDAANGLEEANTVASVRIAIDSTGAAINPGPSAPFALVARSTAGGGCHLAWSYPRAIGSVPPANFLVWLTPGTTASTAGSPSVTVPYAGGIPAFTCELAGLADGTTYAVSVAARSAASGLGAGSIGPPVTVVVTGDATPPDDVDALAVIGIP